MGEPGLAVFGRCARPGCDNLTPMNPKRGRGGTSRVFKSVSILLTAVLVGALVMVYLEREPEGTVQAYGLAEDGGIVVVGDSHTQMNSTNFGAGQIGDGSWVSTLIAEGYRFAGGWAVSGATTVLQANSFEGVERAETLLMLTGTNDLAQGVPFEETASSLDAIVAKAPTERVVVLAIPPLDREFTPTTSRYNESLQELAEDRGWEYFDGFGFLRSPDGGFVEGMTYDGIHLTPEAQTQFGQAVADYLDRETVSADEMPDDVTSHG